jgi:CBS domain-containing protein
VAEKHIGAVLVCEADGALAGLFSEAEIIPLLASSPELAKLTVRHAVKRIAILRDGRIAGIVSWSDPVVVARSPAMLV